MSSTNTHRVRLPRRLFYVCTALAVVALLFVALIRYQMAASPAPTTQRYTLCSPSAISQPMFERLWPLLHDRLPTDAATWPESAGISTADITRASSHCITITLTEVGNQRAVIAAAGQIGTVVIADSQNVHLAPGTHIRLVSRTRGCLPQLHADAARRSTHPPALPIVLTRCDFISGETLDDEVTGRINGGHTSLVTIHLNKKGQHTWCAFVRGHLGRSFAAIVDGVVASSATIHSRSCAAKSITLRFDSLQQAFRFGDYIVTGPLPLPLRLQDTMLKTRAHARAP